MRFVCLLPVLALLFITSVAARADEFSRIENSPYTYWVPAPTPPAPGYADSTPPPYYYGPPPPAPPIMIIPRFFFGFHFH